MKKLLILILIYIITPIMCMQINSGNHQETPSNANAFIQSILAPTNTPDNLTRDVFFTSPPASPFNATTHSNQIVAMLLQQQIDFKTILEQQHIYASQQKKRTHRLEDKLEYALSEIKKLKTYIKELTQKQRAEENTTNEQLLTIPIKLSQQRKSTSMKNTLKYAHRKDRSHSRDKEKRRNTRK